VLVAGDRIVATGSSSSIAIPAAAQAVKGRGKFLIPGLWDMHVHIADESYLPLFVANGVTGVRDMGGGLSDAGDGCESVSADILGRWRALIESGELAGPRIIFSGPPASGTGWPTSIPVRTVAQAGAAIARLQALRVDFVKIYDAVPRDAYLRLARNSRAAGLPFAGHVPDDVGPVDAIRAGQRSIEHVRDPVLVCFTHDIQSLERFFAADKWTPDDVEWGRRAHGQCPSLIAAFKSHEAWLTPTLTVEKAKVAVEDAAYVSDVRRRALPPSVQTGFATYVGQKRAQDSSDRASERLWWRTQRALVGRMHRAGVRLLAGTDSACQGGLPGYALHHELKELVAAGLSPLDALRTATSNPAAYFNKSGPTGVKVGASADLVLLDDNPLRDIRNSQRIAAVVSRGRLLRREQLDRWKSLQATPR
jgi:imidazolonepropionase-like amidohydrolase